MPMEIPNLPQRSIVKMVACLVMSLATIGLLVYPEYAALERHDLETARLRAQIEAQETLMPLFQEMLKKSRVKDTGRLVLTERKPWSKQRADELMAWLEEAGRKSRLAVEVRLPDAVAMIKPGAQMNVDLVIAGNFADFEPFLVELIQAPFLDHIERIQILAGDGGQQMRLKLWIAQV